MRKGWNLLFTSLFCLAALLWLQVVAPPWLALFAILVWLSKETWYVRASAMFGLGLLWSAGAGISGVWGILVLALLFWLEKVGARTIHDKRWRIWLVAGVVSVVWSWLAGVSWNIGVVLWWLIQGGIAGFILRSFRQKAL